MRGFRISATVAVGFGLLATACSGSSTSPTASPAARGSSASSPAATPVIRITPGNGSKNVKPSTQVAVNVAHGTLTEVTVRSQNGTLLDHVSSPSGIAWSGQLGLGVSQSYTVTATATSASGQRITSTSTFRTLTPSATFITQIFEGYQAVYGVEIGRAHV